jgi:hypothetical protein
MFRPPLGPPFWQIGPHILAHILFVIFRPIKGPARGPRLPFDSGSGSGSSSNRDRCTFRNNRRLSTTCPLGQLTRLTEPVSCATDAAAWSIHDKTLVTDKTLVGDKTLVTDIARTVRSAMQLHRCPGLGGAGGSDPGRVPSSPILALGAKVRGSTVRCHRGPRRQRRSMAYPNRSTAKCS